MAESVNVADFRRFATRLKGADRKVRTRMRRRLRAVALEIAPEVMAEGVEAYPAGLAAHVEAKGKPTVTQTSTGVSVVFGKRKGPQIGLMNEGRLRHPTFGHGPWVPQSIPAGTFTEALDKRLPRLRKAVGREVKAIMKELG